MKKIFTILVLGTVISGGAFAKKWTNNVGIGFTLPISQFSADESGADDIMQVGYGLEATYVGIHQSGFTVKADVSGGLATSNDIKLQDDDTNLGYFSNISLGAGWTFVRTEKFTFSATGMLGFDFASFIDSNDLDEEVDGKTYETLDTTFSFGMFSVGADLFASYRLTEHFGLFANVSARYLVTGGSTLESEWTYKDSKGYRKTESGTKDGPDLKGNFCVQPTIGVIWNF